MISIFGKVGIGTTSPDSKLTVYRPSTQFLVNSNGDATISLQG